jgi:Domain of unknown function (DUF397)
VTWRTSSRSTFNGSCVECASFRSSAFCASNECIEAGSWRTSSHSGSAGDCAEIGCGEGVVGVRDSKLPVSPVLEFTPAAWTRFVGAIRVDILPKPR